MESQISLTASDGTGLEMRGLEAKIVLDGFLAFTELTLVFYNPENRIDVIHSSFIHHSYTNSGLKFMLRFAIFRHLIDVEGYL